MIGSLQKRVLMGVLLVAIWCTLLTMAAEDLTGAIENKIESLPKDTNELKEQYLSQQWENLLANRTIVGVWHAQLKNWPVPFTIIFGEPYTFSFVFIVIVTLWMLVAIRASEILKATSPIRKGFTGLLGIGVAILLAQAKVLRAIGSFLEGLLFKQEFWWMRVIIVVFIFLGITVLFFFSKYLSILLNSMKKNQKEAKLEQSAEKVEGFIQGIEKGKK